MHMNIVADGFSSRRSSVTWHGWRVRRPSNHTTRHHGMQMRVCFTEDWKSASTQRRYPQASGSLQVLPTMLCEHVDGSGRWNVELKYRVAWLIQFCTDALQLACTRVVQKSIQKYSIIPLSPPLAARERAQRRSPHGYRRRKLKSKCLHIPILIF